MPSRSTYRLFLLSLAAALERTAAGLVATLGLFFLTEALGLSAATALSALGAFQALTYLAGIVGGIVADRLLGRLPAMLIGAATLALGYLVLAAAPREQLQLAGLLLIAGHGLFKPCLAAEVGRVGSELAAEQWYYFAANVGLALGPIMGSVARGIGGWPATFWLPAAAMVLTVPVLVRYHALTSVTVADGTERSDASEAAAAQRKLSGRSIQALALLLVGVVMHGMAYHQVGGTLLVYAAEALDRRLFGYAIPAGVFGALPAVFTVALMPLLASTCRRFPRGLQPERQLVLGSLATAGGFCVLLIGELLRGSRLSSPPGLVVALLVITVGEVLLLPTSLQLSTAALPRRHRSLAAALWCVSIAAGQWLAGLLGGAWQSWRHSDFFALMVMVSLIAAVVLLCYRQARARAMHTAGLGSGV